MGKMRPPPCLLVCECLHFISEFGAVISPFPQNWNEGILSIGPQSGRVQRVGEYGNGPMGLGWGLTAMVTMVECRHMS